MQYEEFRQTWVRALRESGLPIMGVGDGDDRLDLSSLDRMYECFVEPIGGQETEPFHSTARLGWRWSALDTARTATTEEDMLTELLGRKKADAAMTERPWLRVDIELAGALTVGKPLSMPPPGAWAAWVKEAVTRLELSERLLTDKIARQSKSGEMEFTGWRGEPEVQAVCQPDGKLMLSAVRLSSWQRIDFPRQWDSPDRKPDEHPGLQLEAFFSRVKAALHAWTESLDHLR